MSHIAYGITAGALFGALAVLSMVPLPFPDKRIALAAAFLDRFAIGFVIATVNLAWPGWVVGLFFGLLLSAPSALVTKAWKPILAFGALGGVIIAILLPRVVR